MFLVDNNTRSANISRMSFIVSVFFYYIVFMCISRKILFYFL